jgi:DMSO reductase anchor subunit/ferredoxin
MSCNHCLDPACLEGCPTDAYEKLANGVVAHHADDCVGCGYCTWTCPYSVPAIQPDRRIATKCDMCQPRLAEGMAPACVGACPTHAITIEKVDVAAWRADHAAADGPGLPDGGLTVSTTRVAVPERLAAAAAGGADAVPAGDWRLEPEHPHWPLVWLTVASQLALGASAAVALGLTGAGGGAGAGLTAGGGRAVAAVGAVAALAGAMLHLGRPVAAWKAMRNLRRSWLSREVALLSLYAALAAVAVLAPALSVPAAVAGVAGVYASARLYLLPGRPAWDSRLTIVRFLATAAALGPALVGRPGLVAAGLGLSVGATALNWARLARGRGRSWRGPLVLELARLRRFTVARLALAALAVVAGLAGAPVAAVLAATLASEVVGRWLFYVTVVPTDVPGSFWRGTPAVAR